eukprot:scaffold129231_cov33-Tisochrysis_lutea.AAC.2
MAYYQLTSPARGSPPYDAVTVGVKARLLCVPHAVLHIVAIAHPDDEAGRREARARLVEQVDIGEYLAVFAVANSRWRPRSSAGGSRGRHRVGRWASAAARAAHRCSEVLIR